MPGNPTTALDLDAIEFAASNDALRCDDTQTLALVALSRQQADRVAELERLLGECRDEIREAWSNVDSDYRRDKHEDRDLMTRLCAALAKETP